MTGSLWEFLRLMPKWYLAFVALLALWLVFVGAEDVWFHATGHPFWPVVCPC